MRKIHGATRSSSLTFRLFSLTLIVLSISFVSFVSIRAQSAATADTDNQSEDITVARVSLIRGILSMMRGDDPDWFDINVNMPVQTGDRLYANDDGRAELQLGSNFFVRLDSKTGMDILELSSDRAQLRMFSGSLVINLRKQPKQSVEIDTPSGAVTLAEAGEFRINVISDIKTEVIVWRGDATVFSEKEIVVQTGQRLILITGDHPSIRITDMSVADEWDKWNQQRDYQLSRDAQSLDYIAENQSVEGAEDLSEYGNWTNTAEYGEVWTPSDVDSDWAPYQDGGWVWRDPCGWTWVSSEPWGWAPYHYGRWTVIGGRWCWVPGSDRHYSPAVVGFIDHGAKGTIGWVPLAPGDKTTRARGRALDGNHVPYVNQRFRNATSIATREGFAGGKSYHHGGQPSEPGSGTGRVVAAPSVIPTRASLATNTRGSAVTTRPTPSYFNRTVVARNNEVPVIRSFTDKVAEIKANGGAPVSAVKLASTGARATRQLIPENAPTKQITGGETQQPRGVASTSSPNSQPLRGGNPTGVQQTNTNQPYNGGINTRGNSPQRPGGTQENRGTGPEAQGNVYRPQRGVEQPQQTPVQGTVQHPHVQKSQTPSSQSDGNTNRPPAVGRTTGREVERSNDNNRQQTPQQQPEQSRTQKPQAPDQQEQRRQQQQERDLQLQQQKEQESQRQQREREQQQQEQDRQAQQQKEQESQRQQREREQQQQEQDRQAQQQKDEESQRQQREREQQQQEQDRQAQQQREQENQRQQRERDQQQETDRRRASQGEQERQRQQADQERQRQAEQDRQRQQEADQDRQRQQQAEQEQQRQAQAEQERQRQAQAEQERQRQAQAEQERQRQAQAEQERQRQQQAEQERQRQQQPVKKDPPTGNL